MGGKGKGALRWLRMVGRGGLGRGRGSGKGVKPLGFREMSVSKSVATARAIVLFLIQVARKQNVRRAEEWFALGSSWEERKERKKAR